MNTSIPCVCWQLLILILFCGDLLAQESFIIRSFVSDELPASRINRMLQDRKGLIWIGSLDGLRRYDGYRYFRYQQNPGDSCALSNSMIWDLSEDAQDKLWVATNGGVNRLNPRTGCFTAFPFPLDSTGATPPDPNIRAVFADSRGGVWAGTLSGSLYRLDLATLRWRPFPTGPPDSGRFAGGTVRVFHEDAQGYLWIGSGMGLSRYDPATGVFTVFQNDPQDPTSLSFNAIWTLFEDKEGSLWIGTNEGGVNRFDRKTGRFTRYRHEPGNPTSLSNNEVFAFCQDDRGLLWIATHGGGLNCLDPRSGRFTAYTQQSPFPHRLNHNQVFSLMKDRQGLIWIGSDGGLNRLDFQVKPFRKYFYQNDYPFNPAPPEAVNSILEDKTGILWLGTANGLIWFDRKTGQSIRYRHDPFNRNSLSESRIQCLAEGEPGELWVGTWGGGLNRMDLSTGRFTSYRHDPSDSTSLAFDQVRYLLKDSKGKIWVATELSLQFYNPTTDRFIRVGEEGTNSCCMSNVYTITEDQDGVFWMGTWGSGFYRWDRRSGKIRQYLFDPANPEGLSSNHTRELFLASDGTLWMHAMGRGLDHMDPRTGRFTLYGQKEGLPNEEVQRILEDEHRRLWVSSRGGICRLDPRTGSFQYFDLNDGLPTNEFLHYSGFRSTRTGEFFFGSINGLLAFHPDSIRPDTTPPPVVITSLTRFDRRQQEYGARVNEWIYQKDSLTLTHRDNVLTFEFAAMHFRNTVDNAFRYQLEGFSDQWIDLGTRREVMFTNLPPGPYVLRVKASNDDGVWNEEGTSVFIQILPPWWQTGWAYALWISLALGALFFAWRYELRRRLASAEARRLLELDAVKTRLYTNITHEFRTPLTVILGMAEHFESQAEASMQSGLALIRRNGRQLLNLVNQMLDLSKVESGAMQLHMVRDDVLHYLRYLAESFHSMAESKRIRLHFLTELSVLNMDYEPLRLQQVVSNLLSNAFKFTPEGGDIYFFANQRKECLEIRVSDTGIGIPGEDIPSIFDRFFQVDGTATRKGEGTGIGLALTRELVQLMKGEISVSNRPGGGAEFTVLLPITQAAEKRAVDLPQTKPSAESSSLLAPPAFVQPANSQAPLLLVVEDNHDVIRYLFTVLNAEYRIELAYNGQQGIEKAIELVPDLIVSDVMMPQKDGFELCHTLKTDARTSHIPIILLTAKADIESKLSGLMRGADAYLAKPFYKEELLAHIRNLLAVRRNLHTHYLAQAGLKAESKGVAIKASPEQAMEHAFIRKIKVAIEADLGKRWEVPELAEEMCVSLSQLHRKLEALTGMHTTEFVRYVRLIKARQLLLDRPEESIAAIGYEVGFSSPNEFSRRFKEVFGLTPGEWRRQKA